MAREGAKIAIAYLEEHKDAEETVRLVADEASEAIKFAGDIGDEAFCEQVADDTVKSFGRLDILVSNAAHQNRKPSLDEVSDDEFDRTFKINVYAYFWLARAALEVAQDHSGGGGPETGEAQALGGQRPVDGRGLGAHGFG